MEGDTYDLFQFADWSDEAVAQGIFLGKIATPLLSDDASKRAVVTAFKNLLGSFCLVEKAHRVEHDQDVGKKKRREKEAEQV